MFLRRKVIESFRNYSNSSASVLYILSAVRTPIGLATGALNDFTASHLFSFVFNEALQRALVPAEDVLSVFLRCSSAANNIIKRSGLSTDVNLSLASPCAMRSFVNAVNFLLEGEEEVCVAGGTVSASNHETEASERKIPRHYHELQDVDALTALDHKNFINARKNGKFQDEIAKINFRMKGKQILISEDELLEINQNLKNMSEAQCEFKHSPTPADGAVAFVLAKKEYILRNQLTPIAKIISFAEEPLDLGDTSSAQLIAIEKALKGGDCQHGGIAQWEVDSATTNMYPALLSRFGVVSSSVNRNGGVLSLGYPIGLSGAKALCHLTHSLAFGEFGCAASCDFSESAYAVLIQKCYQKTSGKPRLSLFTKDPCPLCDDLKEQLKPFQGRFSLKEIDIEGEGNAAYKGLYKHEIPVLFLEGRFLCKHKLDAQHFNRRLSEFEDFA